MLIRLDTAVFVAVGLAYLAVLFFVYPGWIRIMRETATIYQSYYGTFRPLAVVTVASSGVIGALLVATVFGRLTPVTATLVLYTAASALAGLAIFVLQLKGWKYQQLPIVSFLAISAAIFIAGTLWSMLPRIGLSRGMRWTIAGAALAAIALSAARLDPKNSFISRYKERPIFATTRTMEPGKPIFVMTTAMDIQFPMLMMQGRDWPSRFPSMWLVSAIERALASAADGPRRDALMAFKREVTGMLIDDLMRYRPPHLLVKGTTPHPPKDDKGDFLNYFMSEPSLEPIRQAYRRTGQVDDFTIFSAR